MSILVRPPSPALAPFVRLLWWFEDPHIAHMHERILPGTGMQILVNLDEDRFRVWEGTGLNVEHSVRGFSVSGLYDHAFAIDTRSQRRLIGAVLYPGAAPAVLGVPADTLASRHVELNDLWGRGAALVRQQLLDAQTPAAALALFDELLAQRISAMVDPHVAFALAALERNTRVVEVARELGWSQKRFRRQFSLAVGVTPKCYARIARLQRLLVCVKAHSHGWAQLASDAGYYDQAHLIAEFRALTGLTPSAYRPRAEDEHNHVVLER
jgi:AraC-like DNA-binding protein